MQIGPIVLPAHPLFLAPMEDITDTSFRRICKNYGADLMYTEFIASDAIIRNVTRSMEKMKIEQQERPIGIQLYGHEIGPMVEAARIAEEMQPDLIDLNFGCPVRKIANRGAGAGMMRDVPKLIEMTRRIVDTVSLPVTVKTRLGWDEQSKNIEEIATRLQGTGIQALTIHGRTRAQLYRGHSDWELIGKIKQNPHITYPIIGNGDIDSGHKAQDYLQRYGVDGLMIGRASIGRPWVFRQVKHFLQHGEAPPPPALAERVALAKTHFRESLRTKGHPRGVYEMRRHFINYFKGLPNFKPLRMKLVTTIEPEAVVGLLDEILATYGNIAMEEPPPFYPPKT